MRTGVIVAALMVASALLATRAEAADKTPGQAAYLKYCSACHGSEGKGDGVVSGALRPPPTDLTLLAKQHDGTFPHLKVMESIDGRKRITAHGDSAMPVWGESFVAEGGVTAAAPATARGKVQLITDYVATIQAH